MSNSKFTPLMPAAKSEPTTADQDWADYFLYLAGQMIWDKRFAKFLPKAQPDSLEAYLVTNGL